MTIRNKQYVGIDFEVIYHDILEDLLATSPPVCKGLSFELMSPQNNCVYNEIRGFVPENAEAFYQWIKSGTPDVQVLEGMIPAATMEMYTSEIKSRSTFYGPRIAQQLPKIIKELQIPDTRRACTMILFPEDSDLLEGKRKGSNVEYPCCIGFSLYIENRSLYMQVLFRSNNMVSTICYDVWNFTRLLCDIREEHFPSHLLGTYTHHILDAHITGAEHERAWEILNTWKGVDDATATG